MSIGGNVQDTSNTIVVTAHFGSTGAIVGSAGRWALTELANNAFGSLYDKIFGDEENKEEAAKKAAMQERVRVAEVNVAQTYQPRPDSATATMIDNKGHKWTGSVQDHKFYIDTDYNGKFDTIYAYDAGQLMINLGEGWRYTTDIFGIPGF